MALGFGFNKAKVLSSAEKFVQQGKLQNAITEYEKIIKEDPKDLTVLNTIGDLYARVGQNDQACHYFKKVGDQYAQNGFTVKAIAIYKKITKLNPSNTESVIKLAELFSQQGLFNDARSQYMHVADSLLKGGDTGEAARVLQKILELDPENATTQAKLADLYMKLGKKEDALNIYSRAADVLYARGSLDAAGAALEKVLKLDPGNANALLMRGMIAANSDDSGAAIEFLEQLPDLDSRPDALAALLKAQLQLGHGEGVEAVANKLLTVHNDMSGMIALAHWYIGNSQVERALKLYDTHTDRFLAAGPTVLQETLYPAINRIKDNPEAMMLMLRIMQKAGDSSHSTEIMELLAHASVQKGDFSEARDLYKKLSELEPENPLHQQNYKQMLARLGEDPTVRDLSPEEGAQAFMVEELEQGAPPIQQTYDASIEKSIEAALTDAELFVSYNVPLKAIAPLEAALPLAPRDVHLNQRLAILYARAERYGDAARVCRVLSEIYRESGHPEEAERYSDAAEKYALRAPAEAAPVTAPVAEPEPVPEAPVEIPVENAAPTVQEFSFEIPDHIGGEAEAPAAEMDVHAAPAVVPEIRVEAEVSEVEVASPASMAHEIDLSGEWESMVDVEMDAEAPPAEQPAPAEIPVIAVQPPSEPEEEVAVVEESGEAAETSVSDKVLEIQFYISESMWEEARAAMDDLAAAAPDAPELNQLEKEFAAAKANASPAIQATVVEEDSSPAAFAVDAAAVDEAVPIEIPVEEFVLDVPEEPEPAPRVEKKPEPKADKKKDRRERDEEPLAAAPEKHKPAPEPLKKPAVAAAPAPAPRKPAIPESEFPLDEIIEITPPRVAPPAAAAAAAQSSTEDILNDFVSDLEESLDDFPEAPSSQPVPVMPHKPAPAPVAAAAATAAAAAPAAGNGRVAAQDTEAASVLSDILSDLQEEMSEPAEKDEDPETHYNLGIAFKEMGLLDEAIGELQKVCHAVDRGVPFSQPIQAFTWLAQCLVDKGVPEAAVRWYERALKLQGLDDNSRCSIYYDLGAAYEASGDRKSALRNFMEVYSSNIDFRDVATRIKALKA